MTERIRLLPQGAYFRGYMITDKTLTPYIGGGNMGDRDACFKRLHVQACTEGSSPIYGLLASGSSSLAEKLYALYIYFGEDIMARVTYDMKLKLNGDPTLPRDPAVVRFGWEGQGAPLGEAWGASLLSLFLVLNTHHPPFFSPNRSSARPSPTARSTTATATTTSR